MSASREGSGNTTVGGQDKRPRGAARLGDGRGIVLARFSLATPRCAPRIAQPAHATIPQSASTKTAPRGHAGHEQRGRLPHPARPHPLAAEHADQALHRPGACRRPAGRRACQPQRQDHGTAHPRALAAAASPACGRTGC